MKTYKAYVDGCFERDLVTWAYIIVDGFDVVSQMAGEVTKPGAKALRQIPGECSSAMRAVLWAKQNNAKVVIYYDYTGIENWATGKWNANNEFTQQYTRFMKDNEKHIAGFVKVKAHNGDVFNDMVDKLSKLATFV